MNPNGSLHSNQVSFQCMVARVERMILHWTYENFNNGVGQVRLPTKRSTNRSIVRSAQIINLSNNSTHSSAANWAVAVQRRCQKLRSQKLSARSWIAPANKRMPRIGRIAKTEGIQNLVAVEEVPNALLTDFINTNRVVGRS